MGQVAELRSVPAVVRPHVRAWRPHTMLYVGLVGLAGALLAERTGSVWELCGAWLVPTLGWVAGHFGGDYVDRELGAVATSHRPVPSGQMGASSALGRMAACATLGAVIGCLLNWRTLLLVGLALLAGIAYSTLLKAHGLAGSLVRGSLTAFAFVFGAMAVRPYPPVALLAVAAVFWLHDTASNLVGTLRDVDGDRACGYDTFPVRHGVTATVATAVALCALWLGLAALAPVPLSGRAAFPAVFWALLGVVTVLVGVALTALVRAPRPVPLPVALRAHEILALERVVLACAFIGLSAGLPTALGLAVPATVLSALLQVSMRSEYEFGPPGATTRGNG